MVVVSEQMRAYYDRRAAEYDDWWLGTGLFENRPRPGWSTEVKQLIEALRDCLRRIPSTSPVAPAS
jgi:hypothetical protein